MQRTQRHTLPAASVRITPAQLRVLEQLANGSTYDGIARALYLSPTTVRTHIENLQRRLGVPNNVTLVLAAVVAGLLTSDCWPVQITGLDEFSTDKLGTKETAQPST